MDRVTAQPPAIFFSFEPLRTPRFFLNAVVSVAALGAFQPNILTHRDCPLSERPTRKPNR